LRTNCRQSRPVRRLAPSHPRDIRIPIGVLLIWAAFSAFAGARTLDAALGLLLFAQDVPVLQKPTGKRSDGLSASGSSASAHKTRNKGASLHHRPATSL